MKAMKWLLAAGVSSAMWMGTAQALDPSDVTKIPAVPAADSNKMSVSGAQGHNRNDCATVDVLGVLNSAGQVLSKDNTGGGDDFDGTDALCSGSGYGTGNAAEDHIMEFTVDTCGIWQFTTCATIAGAPTGGNMCGTCDTSLQLLDGTAGCPGTVLACNGDQGGGSPTFCSNVSSFLLTGTTYYLILDSYGSGYEGPADIFAVNAIPCCTQDSDCSDGVFCNGVEDCNEMTGECLPGAPPCQVYQTCDEGNMVCVDPDPCIAWATGTLGSGFFLPATSIPGCPGSYVADDAEFRVGAGREVQSFSVQIVARTSATVCVPPFDPCPIGAEYFIDLELWDIDPVNLTPLNKIPGCSCLDIGGHFVLVGGSPPDVITCSPAPGTCIVPPSAEPAVGDVWMSYNITGAARTGQLFPANEQTIGGPALDDEAAALPAIGLEAFGNCPDDGTIPTLADFGAVNDWEDAIICTVPVGPCCQTDGTCGDISEADCMAAGGTYLGDTTLSNPDTCGSLPDGDGDGSPDTCDLCPADPNKTEGGICGCGVADTDTDSDGVADCNDNCDNAPNPMQENSDGDTLGDACDNCVNDDNEDQANADGDNHGDVCDICPGGNDADDVDSDGTPDFCDGCPNDPNKIDPGVCGCGVADVGDSDNDGVLDCVDVCPGADDAVFGACPGAIPTVSEWGVVVLALLLLAAGKVYFGRRTVTA